MPTQNGAIITQGLYAPTSGGGITLPSYTAGPPNPITDIARFVMTRLLGDSTVVAAIGGSTNPRIFRDVAPQALTDDGDDAGSYPMILFSIISAEHRVGNGSLRGLTNPLVRITAISQTQDPSTIEALASRIDVLFSGRYMATLATLKVMGGFAERAISDFEVSDGVVYMRIGGEYRLFVHY